MDPIVPALAPRDYIPVPARPGIAPRGGAERAPDFPPHSAMPISTESPSTSDRRSNLVLRALIDEMLERVRELNRNAGSWPAPVRAKAEADLDAIMARVRRVASQSQLVR